MEKRRTLSVRRRPISCLRPLAAIPPVSIHPTRRFPARGPRFPFDWGEVNPPQPRFCLRQNACAPRGGGALSRPWEMRDTWSQAQAGNELFRRSRLRPGLRISPHGRFPPAGRPFFHSVEAKLIRLNQGFASGKTLVRRGAAGRFRARGRCGTPGHRLRLAMNCFAVRGVRPGLRISPHGRFPPAGAPFFHSVEAKLIRLNRRLCLRQNACTPRSGGALPRPWEMRDTRSQAQAGNKLFRRSRRPARVAHLPPDRLGTADCPGPRSAPPAPPSPPPAPKTASNPAPSRVSAARTGRTATSSPEWSPWRPPRPPPGRKRSPAPDAAGWRWRTLPRWRAAALSRPPRSSSGPSRSCHPDRRPDHR